MEELANIINKYDEAYISENLSSLDELDRFALAFFKDVVEIYDCVTRIKNIARGCPWHKYEETRVARGF